MNGQAGVDQAPLLSVRDAAFGWGRRTVLEDVTFDLRPGECVGVVGPNGSGKTTLLRAVLGLAAPRSGRVERSPRWRAGYVPQRDSLQPVLLFRAGEVVEMFARQVHRPAAAARAAALEALRCVGLESMADRPYRDLSGGQRQRVLMARALAVEPTVLVLDEPTAGMDVRSEAELLALVRRIRAERALAVLLVTHALHVAATEADTVGVLHDGRAEFGPPASLLTSASLSRIYGCTVEFDAAAGCVVACIARAEER